MGQATGDINQKKNIATVPTFFHYVDTDHNFPSQQTISTQIEQTRLLDAARVVLWVKGRAEVRWG